ncbi:LOW QUALITY PROTEIN: hypothetical protein CVT26_002658 [Gymnopilus dilepis]|uniref:Uncharacterized protein n=1 Tax=Gymnopilus dilepis TaxID=231916 RepID=A0A409VCK7_9AGAR|nr:LOW QUALITY PROTEIN: hypothetical protein CVT26_002658 [Gymnopilus dilepis]
MTSARVVVLPTIRKPMLFRIRRQQLSIMDTQRVGCIESPCDHREFVLLLHYTFFCWIFPNLDTRWKTKTTPPVHGGPQVSQNGQQRFVPWLRLRMAGTIGASRRTKCPEPHCLFEQELSSTTMYTKQMKMKSLLMTPVAFSSFASRIMSQMWRRGSARQGLVHGQAMQGIKMEKIDDAASTQIREDTHGLHSRQKGCHRSCH